MISDAKQDPILCLGIDQTIMIRAYIETLIEKAGQFYKKCMHIFRCKYHKHALVYKIPDPNEVVLPHANKKHQKKNAIIKILEFAYHF